MDVLLNDKIIHPSAGHIAGQVSWLSLSVICDRPTGFVFPLFAVTDLFFDHEVFVQDYSCGGSVGIKPNFPDSHSPVSLPSGIANVN
jgi:hypothetical protein